MLIVSAGEVSCREERNVKEFELLTLAIMIITSLVNHCHCQPPLDDTVDT